MTDSVNPTVPAPEHRTVTACRRDRQHCLELEQNLTALKIEIINSKTAFPPEADSAEMIANVMLAYRHIEDARMRLGKVIQAFEGGVLVFPM